MTHPARRTFRLASTAVLAGALALAGCTSSPVSRGSGSVSSSTPARPTQPADRSPSLGSSRSGGASGSTRSASASPVHIRLKFADGQTFGVGIPVIAYFSKAMTDATALQNATTLRVNGTPVTGGRWYFEQVVGVSGYRVEGDYRMRGFWPPHAQIEVGIPARGLSAGDGMTFDDSLTLSFSTGAEHRAVVENVDHRLRLYTDGRLTGSYPVSLGARDTRTLRGTKVIMEKGASICMHGPGYHECGVRYTQRLTYDGEYLHAAPWNCVGAPGCTGPANNIGSGNSSNGCTNLLPDDAKALYRTLRIGDVVQFPDADGGPMTLGAGYGDWNVLWSQWLTGGDVRAI